MKTRRGPGRPTLPAGKKKVAINVKLPPDLISLMDALPGSRNRIIEDAIRDKYPDAPR